MKNIILETEIHLAIGRMMKRVKEYLETPSEELEPKKSLHEIPSPYWDIREQESAQDRAANLDQHEKTAYLFGCIIVCLAAGYYRFFKVVSPDAIWDLLFYGMGVLVWLGLAASYHRESNRFEFLILLIQSMFTVFIGQGTGMFLHFLCYTNALIILRATVRLSLIKMLFLLICIVGLLCGSIYWGDPVVDRKEAWRFLLVASSLTGWVSLMYRWALDRRVTLLRKLLREHQVTTELFHTNLNMQDRLNQEVADAVRRERLTLARELHDTVAYTCTTIAAGVETGLKLVRWNFESGEKEFHHVLQLTREVLRELRGYVRKLRENAKQGYHGPERWKSLVAFFQEGTGVLVSFEITPGFPRLVDELDEVVYRFIQEGMINAYRHGRAKVIWVKVWIERAHLCVLLRDNGCGTNELSAGYGIMGMQERLHALGGHLSWRTEIGAGFDLAMEIPLAKKGDDEDDQGLIGG